MLQNYGCNGNLLCDCGVVERTAFPLWKLLLSLLLFFTPVLNSQGMKKNYAMQYKKVQKSCSNETLLLLLLHKTIIIIIIIIIIDTSSHFDTIGLQAYDGQTDRHGQGHRMTANYTALAWRHAGKTASHSLSVPYFPPSVQ